MACLGELCSHVGALLFAVEAAVRILESETCTSAPCQWLMPTPVSNVPYQKLREINFMSSKTKKKKVDDEIAKLSTPNSCINVAQKTETSPKTQAATYKPDQKQIKTFYESLHASKTPCNPITGASV